MALPPQRRSEDGRAMRTIFLERYQVAKAKLALVLDLVSYRDTWRLGGVFEEVFQLPR